MPDPVDSSGTPPDQPPVAPADAPPEAPMPSPPGIIPVWGNQQPSPAGSPVPLPGEQAPPATERQPLGPGRTAALLALAAAGVAVLVNKGVIDGETIRRLAVLFPSVILHEVSHGVVALAFGDDTAKREGRLTLNPLPHVDLFGTIILPTMLVLANAPAFGWAKPVPVNVRNLRSPRNHAVLVSLAGPAVNLVLALIAAFALRSVLPGEDLRDISMMTEVLITLGTINVVLAVFNLLPIPPLDGSSVVERLLPTSWWPQYLRLRQYSMPILLILVLMVPGALDKVFDPALRIWAELVV